MTNYDFLIQPETLIFKAESVDNWFAVRSEINNKDLNEIATEVAMSWTEDYRDSDQGFGSSDGTYMLKEFLDNAISFSKTKFKTDFINNRLSIINK
jgi:hypothetical protein